VQAPPVTEPGGQQACAGRPRRPADSPVEHRRRRRL